MNGIAVLVALAAVGVDYGWQPTSDGQLEYIIQIEPGLLEGLKNGEEIVSEIPPEARGVRKFRIRVGTGRVPRIGQLQQGTSPRSLNSPNLPTYPTSGSTGVAPIFPPQNDGMSSSGSAASLSSDIFRPDGFLNLPPPPPLLGADGKSSVLVRPGNGSVGGTSDLGAPAASSATTNNPNAWQPNMSGTGNPQPSSGGVYPPTVDDSSFPTGTIDPVLPPSDYDLETPNDARPVRPVPSPGTDSSLPNPIRFGQSGVLPPGAGNSATHGPELGQPGINTSTGGGNLLAEVTNADAASLKPELDEETAKKLEAKPWTPLVLTSLALFASLAANAYLGWVALGIYRRYRDMVDQLHQAQASLT